MCAVPSYKLHEERGLLRNRHIHLLGLLWCYSTQASREGWCELPRLHAAACKLPVGFTSPITECLMAVKVWSNWYLRSTRALSPPLYRVTFLLEILYLSNVGRPARPMIWLLSAKVWEPNRRDTETWNLKREKARENLLEVGSAQAGVITNIDLTTRMSTAMVRYQDEL